MKKNIFVLLIFAFQLLLISCENTQDKLKKYIDNYNKSANYITNTIIKRTHAEIVSANGTHNDIKIVFVLGLQDNETNKGFYDQIIPTLVTSLIKNDKEAADLINHGVKFEFVFCAMDGAVIKKTVVDEQKIKDFLSDKPKASTAANAYGNKNLPPQMNELLVILNKGLPIVDKTAGTKITKIDINVLNELVYTVEINEDLIKLIKASNYKDLMKDEIVKSPIIKNMFQNMKKFNVRIIKYNYVAISGKLINETIITEKDLR